MQDNDLRPIWDELLKIYKVFADICERHNLRYYVTDGSAIGAVRHGGFIPWDDDLDVSMPRPDYEKFMELAKKELPSNLVAFDRRQCPDLKVLFGKVQEVREEKVHEVEKKVGRILSNGLFIDIFPIDGCPSSLLKIWRLKFRLFALIGVQRYRCDSFAHYSIKGRIMWLWGWLCTHVSSSMRSIRNVDDFLNGKERLVLGYEYDQCDKVVRLPNAINRLVVHEKCVWGEGKYAAFDGVTVKLPADVDAHLRALFGNYMQLPPVEKRHPTHTFNFYFPWWVGPGTRGNVIGERDV